MLDGVRNPKTQVDAPWEIGIHDVPGPLYGNKAAVDAAREAAGEPPLPLPCQVVSNEEFHPLPQTPEQAAVEHRLRADAERRAARLGLTRRAFLRTGGGMAAAFLAMNAVFGPLFDVTEAEAWEGDAERWPKDQFIFDIQTHHVKTGRDIPAILGFRRTGALLNPELRGSTPKMEDVWLANYVKEIFLDSDTVMAVISGFPSPTDSSNILPPVDMAETRARLNYMTGSTRMLSHGLMSPDLGPTNLDSMRYQAEVLKVDAWKSYTGQPLGGDFQGWWLDDEERAYPCYELTRELGVDIVCVHKGLPLTGFNVEKCKPTDVPKAARDWPELTFILYHSALQSAQAGLPAARENFEKSDYVPWVSDICKARRENPDMRNVFMELGSTFGALVVTSPLLCAHVLGMIIRDFGADHVLWGTDSVWWGSPQWQIEAFRRLRMPESLQERFGYDPLTDEVKEKILGLNAARVYGVDVDAVRNAVPDDWLSKVKQEYWAMGPDPSNTQYGWVPA